MDENMELMEMNNEVNTEEEVIEDTHMPTGLAMLIGSGITLAAIAGVKKGRKLWTKIKSKRDALKTTDEADEECIDAEYEPVEDEAK